MAADVSTSQLLGASDNLKAAGLKDKIELLKVSVIGKIFKSKHLGELTYVNRLESQYKTRLTFHI